MHLCFVLESANLAFSGSPLTGGSELQVRFIAEALAKSGHDISVACVQPFRSQGVHWVSLTGLPGTLRKTRPDAVVATIASRTTLRTALCCRVLGIPFVYRLAHDVEAELRTNRNPGGNVLERVAFEAMLRLLTHRIWCQHEGQRTKLERRGFGGKLFVFRNVFPMEQARAAGKRTVLWVGRNVSWKRPELFVELAFLLPARRCVMVLAGAHAELRRGCPPNLTLLDGVPFERTATLFREARVFVNTSLHEGFPNTFIQAAMARTPIVSLGVDPERLFATFGHGVTTNSPDEAARIIEALFSDRLRFAQMSTSAARYAKLHDIGHVHELPGLLLSGEDSKTLKGSPAPALQSCETQRCHPRLQ